MKDISVICPVYNVLPYIEACIKSIIEQENIDLEVILIDDYSSDDGARIAEQMLKNAEITYYVIKHEKNKGLSAARNSGLSIASADCVFFIDSDDVLHDKYSLCSLLSIMREEDADCVAGNYYAFSEDCGYTSRAYSRYIKCHNGIDAFVLGIVPVMATNTLIKRKIIYDNNIRFKEGFLIEDELWNYQVLVNCGSVISTGMTTYDVRVREGSIMNDNKKIQQRLLDASKIYSLMVQYTLVRHNLLICSRLSEKLNLLAFYRLRSAYRANVSASDIKKCYKIIRQAQSQLRGTMSGKCIVSRIHLMLPAWLGCMMMVVISKLVACRKRCVRKS